MQILIVRLSALANPGIENRCFSVNYEDTSHSGGWALQTKGKHSSRTMGSGGLQFVDPLECRLAGTSCAREVPD